VNKHVGILEEVDLVAIEKVGRARECQLGPAQLEDATARSTTTAARGRVALTGSAHTPRRSTAAGAIEK
jgi:hypothetical protein